MATTHPLEGIELLLVDDEPGVLRALSLLLMGLRCKVTALASPLLALEHLEGGARPDAIISDLRMPQMNGSEFLFTLRKKGYTTPFILMSGHATPQEVEMAKAGNLAGFLPKPFMPQELVNILIKASPAVQQRAANIG